MTLTLHKTNISWGWKPALINDHCANGDRTVGVRAGLFVACIGWRERRRTPPPPVDSPVYERVRPVTGSPE